MLKVNDLHVYYGAIHALKGVSFAIERGELVTLLGANGAGKTTTLKTLSGLLRPRHGSVELDGEDDLVIGQQEGDGRERHNDPSPLRPLQISEDRDGQQQGSGAGVGIVPDVARVIDECR